MPLERLGVDHSLGPPRSIADQIYDSLKSSITNGEFEPGRRLLEVEIAGLFKASRTPVREALRRLEQDHLVERIAQGGVRVIHVDRQTIFDVYGIRTALEAHAMELACDRITPEQIAALKQIRAQVLELLESRNVSRSYMLNRLFDLNSRFHELIYEATRSKFLIKVISNLREIVLGMRAMTIQVDQDWANVWDEHSRLIGHLERGEKTAAVYLIKEHMAHAADQAMKVMHDRACGE